MAHMNLKLTPDRGPLTGVGHGASQAASLGRSGRWPMARGMEGMWRLNFCKSLVTVGASHSGYVRLRKVLHTCTDLSTGLALGRRNG